MFEIIDAQLALLAQPFAASSRSIRLADFVAQYLEIFGEMQAFAVIVKTYDGDALASDRQPKHSGKLDEQRLPVAKAKIADWVKHRERD